MRKGYGSVLEGCSRAESSYGRIFDDSLRGCSLLSFLGLKIVVVTQCQESLLPSTTDLITKIFKQWNAQMNGNKWSEKDTNDEIYRGIFI